MDIEISKWVVRVFGENQTFATFLKVLTFGGSVWFVLGIVLILLIFKRTRKCAIFVLASVAICYISNDFIIKPIVARARPFVSDPSLKVMCELANLSLPTGYSMASGHAAVTMALAVMLMIHSWKLGIPAMVYSIAVGLSRIFLCVHYLTDVLAGFALGAIIAVLTYFFMAFIFKKISTWREKYEKINSGDIKQEQDKGV